MNHCKLHFYSQKLSSLETQFSLFLQRRSTLNKILPITKWPHTYLYIILIYYMWAFKQLCVFIGDLNRKNPLSHECRPISMCICIYTPALELLFQLKVNTNNTHACSKVLAFQNSTHTCSRV